MTIRNNEVIDLPACPVCGAPAKAKVYKRITDEDPEQAVPEFRYLYAGRCDAKCTSETCKRRDDSCWYGWAEGVNYAELANARYLKQAIDRWTKCVKEK